MITISRALDSRRATLVITIILGGVLILLHWLRGGPQTASANPFLQVVYLVPDDLSELESQVRPKEMEAAGNVVVQLASDWPSARKQIEETNADALIIHYTAMPLVDTAELSERFLQGELTVTGIGIPGLDLALAIGAPSLFTSTWSSDQGYTTPLYFYTYSLSIVGTADDVMRWQNRDALSGEAVENIEKPMSISGRATTESLLYNDSELLIHVIESHVRGMKDELPPVR
ncbi:MAG: hypothetical protein RRC07_18000 [Anaerolineae bacterium]|nr:hypothetical protein [Anaerolineae bacterium]